MDVESEDYSELERESPRDHDESLDQDEAGHAPSTSSQPPVQRLSCDSCRNRKVRCDRRDPCSRCLRMKTACTYTAQRPLRKKRPRILVSSQYENKIDDISRKIDAICKLFNDEQGIIPTPRGSSAGHVSAHQTPVTSPPPPPPAPSAVATERRRAEEEQPREPEYEGGSALSAHTAFATMFLQTAVSRDGSTPVPPETASALHDLHLTAEGQPDQGESLREQLPNATHPEQTVTMPELSMPSAQMVFAGLRLARDNLRVQRVLSYEFESLEQFQDYFLSVYGSSQPTVAEKIICLAGLLPLFSECAYVAQDKAVKDQYAAQAALCRESLETHLAGLPFHLPSTFDYVLALTLAAGYSVGRCRPALAWNFNCTAARMSQAMGFQKAALLDTEPSEAMRRKARVFAFIYMTDKMLSLRLGRGSFIRDEEMPADHGKMLRWVNTAPNKFPRTWLRFAQIQGQVYELLYSPEALRQPMPVREARARCLAQDLDADTADECDVKEAYEGHLRLAIGERHWSLMCHGNRVTRLTLMCLIQRNLPPPAGSGASFSEECISIAREALAEHGVCMAGLSCEPGSITELYFNWALLTSPFVPFIVLLCNVAETCNPLDLELLGSMITSIEGIGETMPSASKQLRLFKPLFEVASKFVEAKTAPAPLPGAFDTFFQDMDMDMPFDTGFLSSFVQTLPQDATEASQSGHADASIIDVWTYLDSPHPG